MSVSLLACLWLFALSQAVEDELGVRPFTNIGEDGCFLQPTMSLEHCVLPPSEVLGWGRSDQREDIRVHIRQEDRDWRHGEEREDKYGGFAMGTDGTDEGEDMKERVPENSYCKANVASGSAVVLRCWKGYWVPGETLPLSEQPHSRHRRFGFLIGVAVGALVCLAVCGGGSQGSSGSGGPPPNKGPTIKCPAIPKTFSTPEGQYSVKVTWSPATASDPEEGNLSVLQTSGLSSGTFFSEGTHFVSYEAKDNHGVTATCTRYFTVKVRRCSPLYVYPSPNMKTPSCQPLYNGHPIFGTECSFCCKPGHTLVGVSKTKCNAIGLWQHSKPACEVKKCGPPPTIPQGSVICGNGPNKHDYDSTCVVSCDAGYQVQGPNLIRCQLSQAWTAPGTCEDEIPPQVICEDNIEKFAGPKRAPVKVTFQLPSATDSSGKPVTVTSDKTSGSLFPVGVTTVRVTALDASNNLDQCNFIINVKVKSCPPFNAPGFSIVSCSHGYAYGSDCTTTCFPGYYLTGDVTQTCLQDQTWSGQQPLCKRSKCSEPNLGSPDLVYDCRHGYFQGESCDLSCKDGNPVVGPQIITCESNTAAGGPKFVWNTHSNVSPTCTTDSCPKLTTPKNGALACNLLGDSGETCSVLCDDKYMRDASTEDLYICSKPLYKWSPPTVTLLHKSCLVKRPPFQSITRPNFYYSSGSCSPDSNDIKQKFLQTLHGSPTWKAYCAANGVSCTLTNADVKVTCHSSARRRKRNANSGTPAQFTVQFTPTINLGNYTDKGSALNSIQHYDNLALELGDGFQTEADQGLFNIPEIGTFDGFYGSLASYDCRPGTFLDHSKLSCAGCGEGHIYNNSSQSCSPCPVGTYQDQEIAYACIPCPGNTSTSGERAFSVEQCHDFCPPGSVSPSGDQPCDLCPKGSYQTTAGMTSCDLCPFGMSTPTQGATGMDDCQFYDVELSSETPGPRIKLYGTSPPALTLLTWVHVISTSPRTTLTFSLDPSAATPKSANLSVDGLHIYLTPTEDLQSQQIRTWYHLAAVYEEGIVSLYVDGTQQSHAQDVVLTDLWRKSIRFSGLDNYQFVFNGLQMSASVLTETDIQQFATSCDARLDFQSNILTVDEPAETEVIESTCDDTDDCQRYSCRTRGTCVDGLSQFTCLCEEPWSGDTCQEAQDLCDDHQCANGGSCVSDYDTMSYKCVCVPPYGGPLCQNFTGCPAPQLREGHDTWRCVRNETTQTQSCEIICDPDLLLLPDIDNSFECGPSTNYSWSHQTEDNPTGILPDCSVQRLPIQAVLEVIVAYDISCGIEIPVRDLQSHIEGELASSITCSEMARRCYFISQLRSSCAVTASSGNMTVSVYLVGPAMSDYRSLIAFREADLGSKPSTVSSVLVLVQQLVENSNDIFNVTIQGQHFTGKIKSTKWHSPCPPGTEQSQGICLDCPAGYYSIGLNKECVPCPVGSYQDQPAQTQCIPCTYGTTVGKGAYSEQLCISNSTADLSSA